LQEEVATLAIEKELFITDKEINSFEKELELNRKKLSDQIKSHQLNEYERKRLTKSKGISVTDVEHVVSSSCDVKQ
jgi:predicted  nucleic acid-binding Zn-ribbon protein